MRMSFLNRCTALSFAFAFFLSVSVVASQASAVEITVGFQGLPASFETLSDGDAMLGCGAPGSAGEVTCTGTEFNNGGWSLEDWTLFADPDPTISNGFSVTNNTGSTQSFFVSVSLPVNVSFGPPSLIKGSVSGSATDAGGSAGVTLSTSTGFYMYQGLIDGAVVEQLIPDDPTVFSTPFGSGSVSVPVYDFGIPVAVVEPVATTTSIGLDMRFDLSAGDRASFTAVFDVQPVPEPGTALLLGLGLAGLAVGRQRA